MANLINFSTYGFLDDILALDENNWRNFFKPVIYDSIQSGLEVTAGSGMTFNVSSGECRCGSVMGILNSQMSLDVNVGDNTYNRIDSVVIQYIYGYPSTLSVTILEGEPSASPVPPTLTKSYNSLWQMEIAQILIPANATTASECTITDKRIIYNSLDSMITPIKEDIDDINTNLNLKAPLLSPALTGTPTAPTAPSGTNTTQVATTAFVRGELNKEILYYQGQTVSVGTTVNSVILRIPASGTNSVINANTVVLECTFADPENVTSKVSWNSYDGGYIEFKGICTAQTSANVTLGQKGN